MLTCEDIIKEFQQFFEINQRSPYGTSDKFSFSRKQVITRFGSWNEALTCAGLPWNTYPRVETICKTCKVVFKKYFTQIKKSSNDFCSQRCAALHRNKNYKMPQHVKDKIRNSIKSKYNYHKECMVCKKSYEHLKRKTCSRECYLITKTNKFRINLHKNQFVINAKT